jgi:hypothetical protein
MLFIPLFVTLCVKLDPGTHKVMHSVFGLKTGCDITLEAIESLNLLSLVRRVVGPH